MSIYGIEFEPTHLTEDELNYELAIRNIKNKGNVRILTKTLRESLIKESKGIFVKPKHCEDASTEVTYISIKLDELDITMLGLEELPNNKMVIDALISRFVHVKLRLERILVPRSSDYFEEIKSLSKRIKHNLGILEKLKTSKITSKINLITTNLDNTILGPRSGAGDVMAQSSQLLASGETASGTQAIVSPAPIVTATIMPPSTSSLVTEHRNLGAYPKSTNYLNSAVDSTLHYTSPSASDRDYVAGRGRGFRSAGSNESRPVFNDKLYYTNSAVATNVPPYQAKQLNNPSSSLSFDPSPNYSNPVQYNKTQAPPSFNQPPYNTTRSVPTSNYNNLNYNAPPNSRNDQYVYYNQQPLNNYTQPPPYQPNLNQCNEEMERPVYQRNPISGWNLFFSGDPNSRSLYDFLSRIEMLARAENISENMLRRSAYYLFTGSAMTWYRAFEHNHPTWTDLVNALKNQFTPVDYDRALLREVDRRKQGAMESFGMYLANMEMLYRGLQRTVVPEIIKLDTIMRNMLPYLAEKLMLADINTIEELSNYCRKIENSQFRLAQTNLNDHTNLLEPQFAYRNPGNQQKDAGPRMGQYPRK